jgi:phosphosulfolactate phosphohydrolase-like enzyme
MNIDVAFTPGEVQALASKVCIVVDVVRATSSLTVIMSREPAKVILTTTIHKPFTHCCAVKGVVCRPKALITVTAPWLIPKLI